MSGAFQVVLFADLFPPLVKCSRERLFLSLGFELFAVNDDKFMDMFVAPGAVDSIQNERLSLLKRQKILLSCLNEFKNISRAL
jgi:hypothetical protein